MCVRPILTMSFHSPAFAANATCSLLTAGMNRYLAPQRRAGNLAAAVGDHFIHIHVELRAAARHPYVQREHVVMLAGEDLVANLNDQVVALLIEALARKVGI